MQGTLEEQLGRRGGGAPRTSLFPAPPLPLPAPTPTALKRKGAHSQWGPARVLMGEASHRAGPQPPHLTRISAYSASSSVRV